jgi:hypothetical protein
MSSTYPQKEAIERKLGLTTLWSLSAVVERAHLSYAHAVFTLVDYGYRKCRGEYITVQDVCHA